MKTFGPQILVRSLSVRRHADRYGNPWQYHSRSDHHSKLACWGIVFDLLANCPLLQTHVRQGKTGFGINHEMRDFRQDRKKDLDLVLCTPRLGERPTGQLSLEGMASRYELALSEEERQILGNLPELVRTPVGSVLLALEAKACMTAHQRALPRLFDELNSSHLTVHGASDQAIAAGFVMVNRAARYLSPDLNKRNLPDDPEWSRHKQPRDAGLAVDKVRQIPRRAKTDDDGYDALAVLVIDLVNDGSKVGLVEESPAPPPGDIHHYDQMIARLASIYATRFRDL